MNSDFEGVLGLFSSPEALQEAVASARRAPFSDLEVYLPVGDRVTVDTVHAGDSPVRWIAAAGGVAGLLLGLGTTIWMSADYPLVTGGKPILSLPPFLVVAFEVMILLAAVGAVAGFLRFARLPSLRPSSAYDPDLAVDRFGLFIRCGPEGDPGAAESVLRAAGALEVRSVHRVERGLLGEYR